MRNMQNNHNQLAVDDSGFFGKKKQEKKLIDQSMVDRVMKAMHDANPIKTIGSELSKQDK